MSGWSRRPRRRPPARWRPPSGRPTSPGTPSPGSARRSRPARPSPRCCRRCSPGRRPASTGLSAARGGRPRPARCSRRNHPRWPGCRRRPSVDPVSGRPTPGRSRSPPRGKGRRAVGRGDRGAVRRRAQRGGGAPRERQPERSEGNHQGPEPAPVRSRVRAHGVHPAFPFRAVSARPPRSPAGGVVARRVCAPPRPTEDRSHLASPHRSHVRDPRPGASCPTVRTARRGAGRRPWPGAGEGAGCSDGGPPVRTPAGTLGAVPISRPSARR